MTSNNDAYGRALAWLAARALTEKELVGRLARIGAAAPNAVVQRLKEEGWQSDREVAEQEVVRALSRQDGPYRLKARLQARGVPDDMASLMLERLDAERQWQAAMTIAQKWPDRDESGRRRLARRLTYKGFPSGIIARVLEQWTAEGFGSRPEE